MEDYVGLCARLQGYADWMDQSVDDYVDEVKDLHLAIAAIEQQAREIQTAEKEIAGLMDEASMLRTALRKIAITNDADCILVDRANLLIDIARATLKDTP